MGKVDILVLGGGMANTFLLAQGKSRRQEPAEHDRVEDARRILAAAEKRGVQVVLPIDVVVAKEVTRGTEYKTVPAEKFPASWHIVDLGEQTPGADRGGAGADAKTVFWNGPLGVFEIPSFAHGTRAIARFLADKAEAGATVVVGGGDSVAAIQQQGLAEQLTHISTGGGASLEFLEGRELPGIAVLQDRPSRRRVEAAKAVVSAHDHVIELVDAREILDSRGNPTVEVDVVARRTARSAARRCRPALDRRQRGGRAARRRQGAASAARASCTAVANVIDDDRARRSTGADAADQAAIDDAAHRPRRHAEQGQPRGERDPRRVARLRARGRGRPRPAALPLPRRGRRADPARSRCFNILNGGKHAVDSTDFQEFMVAPVGADDVSPRRCAPGPRSSRRSAAILHDEGHATGQGDEGGFAPCLPSNEAAVEVILRAIETAGYRPGEDVAIALDPATSSILVEGTGADGVAGRYRLETRGPDARLAAS